MTQKNYRRFIRITFAVALIAMTVAAGLALTGNLFSTGGGRFEPLVVEEERRYDLTAIKSLSISSGSPDIKFLPGSGEELVVRFYGTIRASSPIRAPHIVEEKKAERLSIGIETPNVVIGFYSANLKMDVYLPESYREILYLDSSSGDIIFPGGVYRELGIESSSGDLELGRIEAEVIDLTTSSGDITVQDLRARVTAVEASSGSISAAGIPGRLTGRTSSGDFRFRFSALTAEARLSCSSGDIDLQLPQETGFDLKAETSSGEITCRFPLTVSGAGLNDEDRLRGQYSGGGPLLDLNTSSGDITVAF